jgi:phosphoethanolamine N-methyltransferase
MDVPMNTQHIPVESHSAQLDASQYTRESILKYEKIYGHSFISTGGLDSTREIVKLLNLQPDMQVLDVGSGIGGSAFHMAQAYGVHVHGLDLSHNMLAIAHERLQEIDIDSRVTFEFGDILEHTADSVYDVVYSRDAFLHIPEKALLFQTLKRALKPGGLMFFTDYCWGEGMHSAEFLEYVAQRKYDLHTVKDYGKLIAEAGFVEVQAMDKTSLFGDYLELELAKLPNDDSLPEIRKSWQDKLTRNRKGEQGWGWFMAHKAMTT